MNRRDFVSRVTLGAAVACTHFASSAVAAPAPGLRFRFVGMMAFIERRDRSFLVATPGQSHHHAAHLPFLMARKNSPIAKALGMVSVPGVIPEAFDTELAGTPPDDFVYRSLENTSIEVISGLTERVINNATQMAELHRIAAGKRVRGNIEKWASSIIFLRGGHLENSAAHPDAGKMWSFGSHRQRLTDAVNYTSGVAAATIRLTSGTEVRAFSVRPGDSAELSIISAARFDQRVNNPARLVHSELLFEYLVDATPVIAECPEATGREVPETTLPFQKATTASAGLIAGEATFPPATEFCYIAEILLGGSGS